MARLYIDENSGALVAPLRDAGHDVIFAAEGGVGQSDFWHFRQAIVGGRAIVTLDTGFYYVHGFWTALMTLELADVSHSGILTAMQGKEQFTHTGWLKAIQTKLAGDEELSGRILTWYADADVWEVDLRPPWKGLI
jgi:hypothetical protein